MTVRYGIVNLSSNDGEVVVIKGEASSFGAKPQYLNRGQYVLIEDPSKVELDIHSFRVDDDEFVGFPHLVIVDPPVNKRKRDLQKKLRKEREEEKYNYEEDSEFYDEDEEDEDEDFVDEDDDEDDEKDSKS